MKPHVHAGLIKAWADGAEIEFRSPFTGAWVGYGPDEQPSWLEGYEYRIKPDPFAPFKEALARGDRVDMRMKKTGHGRGYGWMELAPGHGVWSDEFEYRIALPWQDERDAFDRGETIHYRKVDVPEFATWTWASNPSWNAAPGWEYRVKPKSKVETFEAGMLMQHSTLPFDGISLKPAPFKLPRIVFDIEHADGEVINVTLKEWTK